MGKLQRLDNAHREIRHLTSAKASAILADLKHKFSSASSGEVLGAPFVSVSGCTVRGNSSFELDDVDERMVCLSFDEITVERSEPIAYREKVDAQNIESSECSTMAPSSEDESVTSETGLIVGTASDDESSEQENPGEDVASVVREMSLDVFMDAC